MSGILTRLCLYMSPISHMKLLQPLHQIWKIIATLKSFKKSDRLLFQLNHHFEKAQTEFCFINHPRFGLIRCIRSNKSIQKGEEIFIDYNYGSGPR